MIVKTGKLTSRKYLAEILEVGTGHLKGYYKVKLIDFEDPNNNIIWVKERINTYMGFSGNGSYYPLFPGDKVIIKFTNESLNTSGVIIDVFTPRNYSSKIQKFDSSLLYNSEKYVTIKTHKNSKLEFDEKNNYTLYSYRSNTGYLKITDDSIYLMHNQNITVEAPNNIKVNSSNITVTSNKTEIIGSQILLHSGSYSGSPNQANVTTISIQEFDTQLQKYRTESDSITQTIQLYTTEDNTIAQNLIKTFINNEQGNQIIQYKKDKQTEEGYTIIIPSIQTLKNKLVDEQKQKVEQISEIAKQLKTNYEQNKNTLKDNLLDITQRLIDNLDRLTGPFSNNSEKITQIKNAIIKLREEILKC